MPDPTRVIMPVLGMNQDSGKIVQWLVAEGYPIQKGAPLLEVETDKAVAEIEAPASGILRNVTAREGDEVPVGTLIAQIVSEAAAVSASPVAARMAAEHNLDLTVVRLEGGRVEKADVLAYLQGREQAGGTAALRPAGRTLASPKARRLAAERGLELAAIPGSGPEGAVLASDIPAASPPPAVQPAPPPLPAVAEQALEAGNMPQEITPGQVWKIMADRTLAAWTQAPHFYLLREVNASRLAAWLEAVRRETGEKITYTDLLVKLAAAALKQHPYVNVTYSEGKIYPQPAIHIGIAAATDEGLVVPVIHHADTLSLHQIAAERAALLARAHAGRLRQEDISGGTFTISNLGMYGVDAFLAVLNPPQAAILAVGRIADRVVPLNGQVVIRPMMALSLSFDHRSVDGARGAQFMDTLAKLIEEPLGLIS